MVAARADRRDVAAAGSPARSRRATPCTTARAGRARRARRRSLPATPRPGPARADRARRGSTRSASRARTPRRPTRPPGRAAARTARRPAGARGRRRSTSRTRRRTATATRGGGSARPAAGGRAARAARRHRRAARRRAAPSAPCPTGGTTHSSVSNGRSTSCGYHHESSCTDADRHAARFEVVDRGDDRRRGVEARLGAVPVRAAVVGPVRQPRAEHVGSRAPARATPDAARSSRGPAREALARAVARDDRELGREAGFHLVDVAVPAHAQPVVGLSPCPPARRSPARGTTQRREQHRATVGRDETERHARPAGRNGSSRQRDIAASLNTGSANSVY